MHSSPLPKSLLRNWAGAYIRHFKIGPTNMKPGKIFRYLVLLLLISANIGCDQVSKSVVRQKLDYHERISVVQDNVVLTKVENSGAFLSLGDDLSPMAKNLLLSALPAITMLMVLVWLFGQSTLSRGAMFALCCVLGGGIGNIFDRIAYGSVTDFIYLQLGFLHTGVFNCADVSITFGVVWLVIQQVFKKNVA